MGCPKKVYIIVTDDNHELQHDVTYTTLEEAKAAIMECVENGEYEINDVEIWAATPCLKPKKLETVWEEIT
jgi:hypothetical protein